MIVTMNVNILLGLAFVAAVAGEPAGRNRIVGGDFTTINDYPSLTPLLYAWDSVNFRLECGGAILNSRSVLSNAQCYFEDNVPNQWRVRVGSTLAHSGGTLHTVSSLIIHPSFNSATLDNDISLIRTATTIAYIENTVQPSPIAGPNYNVADNQAVWAAGWGASFQDGWNMETLRHVQIWTINQSTCAQRYATINRVVTNNMLCSGWLDVGGRNQCHGDDGGPLFHNGVIIGVTSWRSDCDSSYFPGVNTRVNQYTAWIQANA